tara:strand:- start:7816 stop:9213 length:1398 start_codon:yes stop_codon:yes gene_type:complete
MESTRPLGITVLADFIINEGIDGVLHNITQRAGASMVALNPTVTAPSEPGIGSYQPPSDAGSSPRLFDRTLWGKKGLWVRGAPSYYPNEKLYSGTPYKPKQTNNLTEEFGPLIGQFIDAALDRGIKVYFQLSAATPSNLRIEDVPKLPDGSRPDRMAETGSLASPEIRDYNRAYVRDLLEQYPKITGFRPDWPEYPCYKLDEAFQDFGSHVETWAVNSGFDFTRIRSEVGAFYTYLNGKLRNRDLFDWVGPNRGRISETLWLRRFPGVLDWLRLKADLSLDLLNHWRQTLRMYGPDKELSANAFMTPLTLFTGFDFTRSGTYLDAVSPKLYTMHWAVMVEFWGRVLMERNPGLDEAVLVKALGHLFDIGDEIRATQLSDFRYPEPHEPHPIDDDCQRRRIKQVRGEVDDSTLLTPLIHGYGPYDDFLRRFKLVAESDVDGAWINRYGYLSDAKLDAVGQTWRATY